MTGSHVRGFLSDLSVSKMAEKTEGKRTPGAPFHVQNG